MPLLDTPADLVWILLREAFGQAESQMDAPSFRDTKSLQQAVGLKWAFAFHGMALTDFCRLAGLQGRALLFQERGLWIYRWDGRPPSLMTFDQTNTLPDTGVVARVTPATELVTELTVKYAQDPANREYREAFTLTSATKDRYAARRGRTRRDEPQGVLELPWVRDAAAAHYLGAWRLSQLDHPRLILALRATWDALAVEKGDVITVSSPMLTAYGGPLGAVVRTKGYALGEDAIDLGAVDAPTQTKTYGVRYVLGSTLTAKTYGVRYDIRPSQSYGVRYVIVGEAIPEEEAVPPSTNDFRLTLATGDPAPVTDQTAKTTLYLTPSIGQSLMLYVGAAWVVRTGGEVSLSLSALAANTVYDIFAFDSAGTVTLEAVAWASATARATALARQDGVWTKSGDPTRRYMGTISTTATAGQCEDSFVKRYVWNARNRVLRPLRRLDPATTWSYTTLTTWRQANANTANEVAVVLGLLAEPIGLGVYCWGWHTASNAGYAMGIGEDSTTTALPTGMAPQVGTSPSQGYTPIVARFDGWPAAIGRHRYVWLERNNTSGTLNLYGTDAGASMNSGMTGTVWA
jgi:Putative phage tail protein